MESGAGPHRHDGGSPRRGLFAKTRRAGGGGRWWLWVGRAVLWAFILVVLFNGIRAPFISILQPAPTSSTQQQHEAFPSSSASAYALQFAHVYLTYGKSRPQERAELLASYLPEDADPQLGWNGEGTLTLRAVQAVKVNALDETHGIVTLAVRIGDQWMRLAVPVYADGDAMVISGQPALMPRPPEAHLPPAPEQPTDDEATRQLRRQLPGFFRAFAGSDTESLARYLASGVSMTGFSGAVRFQSLDNVVVPEGDHATRHITATVTWQLRAADDAAAGELQQTYRLTVTKDEGRWYVKAIQGAPSMGFS